MNVSFINAWGILIKGGPLMWPILVLSVLAVTLGIEKFLLFNKVERALHNFKPLFFKALQDNRLKDALDLCEEASCAPGPMCKAGLMKFGSSGDLIKATMEEEAAFEIAALKGRLSVLGFIVNTAPLLGLLGTTTALCVVFHAAQMRSNALNPLSLGDLSSGIWQAMITTSAGLSVGIVSFAIHSFLAARLNGLIAAFGMTIQETGRLLQSVSECRLSESMEHEP